MLVGLRISRYLHIAIDAKNLSDRHLHVGHASDGVSCSRHKASTTSEPSEARIGLPKRSELTGNLAEPRGAAKAGPDVRKTPSFSVGCGRLWAVAPQLCGARRPPRTACMARAFIGPRGGPDSRAGQDSRALTSQQNPADFK